MPSQEEIGNGLVQKMHCLGIQRENTSECLREDRLAYQSPWTMEYVWSAPASSKTSGDGPNMGLMVRGAKSQLANDIV